MLALTLMAGLLSSCGGGNSTKPSASDDVLTISTQGAVPWGLALNGDNTQLYVSNVVHNSVSIYKTATMEKIADIPTACMPTDLAFNADYSQLYVAHNSMTSCRVSQISPNPISGKYISVIDVANQQVIKEIAITAEGRDLELDPVNNFLYVTALNNAVCIIETTTNTLSACYSSTSSAAAAPLGDTTLKPSKIKRMMIDNSPVLMALDPANKVVAFKLPVNPILNTFTARGFNGQEDGYCVPAAKSGGFDTQVSGQPNGCACLTSGNCSSGNCDSDFLTPVCAPPASCGATSNRSDGCDCTDASQCRGGLCQGSVCKTPSVLNFNSSTAYCDRVNSTCYDKNSDYTKLFSVVSKLGAAGCTEPWDIVPLPDGTAYLSCYGPREYVSGTVNTAHGDPDPVIRLMWGKNGIARNSGYLLTYDSLLLCDKPSEMAASTSGDMLAVACADNVSIVNTSTGKSTRTVNIPTPVNIVADSKYAYATSGTSNKVYRITFPVR